MSSDISVVCDCCQLYRHAGQRMGKCYSFGYGGSGRKPQADIARFMVVHAFCYPKVGIRVILSDWVPDEFTNDEDADHCENCNRVLRNGVLHNDGIFASYENGSKVCFDCVEIRVAREKRERRRDKSLEALD